MKGNRRPSACARTLHVETLEQRQLLTNNTFELVGDTVAASTLLSDESGSSEIRTEALRSDANYQSLDLPASTSDSVQISVSVDGVPVTLDLHRYSVRSENFRLLLQRADGSLEEVDAGPEKTFRGTVAGYQNNFRVNAVFLEAGLKAVVYDDVTDQVLLTVTPAPEKGAGIHRVGLPVVDATDSEHDPPYNHDESPTATDLEPSLAAAARPEVSTVVETQTLGQVGAVLTASTGEDDSPLPAPAAADAVVLNPVSIRQAELAFDVPYETYSTTYGSNTTAVMDNIAELLSDTGNERLGKIWITDALIEHRLGTVVIRTDQALDPYQQAGLVNRGGTDSGLLNEFRDIWNSGVHGTTHDVAHLMNRQGGGLAWVGTAGGNSSFRYSQGGGSVSSWQSFARHEIGHNWGLGHSHGGRDFFDPQGRRYGIMWDDAVRDRMTPLEQQSVVNRRNAVASTLNSVGAYTAANIKPYAKWDTYNLNSPDAVILDVLANDHDANNDPIYIRGVGEATASTFVSPAGSTVEIVHGGGSQGQDVLRYTPAPNATSDTFFYYVGEVGQNGSSLSNWGVIEITNPNAGVTVDLDQDFYAYDFGTSSSPVADNFIPITPQISGEINWSRPVSSRNIGSSSGFSTLYRDYVYGMAPTTFEHKIQNGIWEVSVNMGDSNAHQNIGLRAEGQLISDDIDFQASQIVAVDEQGASIFRRSFDVRVEDGSLSLELFVSSPGTEWLINSLTLESVVRFESPELPGDFNLDEVVDGDDLPVWQSSYGSAPQFPFSGADVNGSSTIDGADFLAWQRNFGAVPPPHAADFAGIEIAGNSGSDRYDSINVTFLPHGSSTASTLFSDSFSGYDGTRLDNPALDGGWDNVGGTLGAIYSRGNANASGGGRSQNLSGFNTSPLSEEGVITLTMMMRLRGDFLSSTSFVDASGAPIFSFGNPTDARSETDFDVVDAAGNILLSANGSSNTISRTNHKYFDVRVTYDTATLQGVLQIGPGSSSGSPVNGPYETIGTFNLSSSPLSAATAPNIVDTEPSTGGCTCGVCALCNATTVDYVPQLAQFEPAAIVPSIVETEPPTGGCTCGVCALCSATTVDYVPQLAQFELAEFEAGIRNEGTTGIADSLAAVAARAGLWDSSILSTTRIFRSGSPNRRTDDHAEPTIATDEYFQHFRHSGYQANRSLNALAESLATSEATDSGPEGIDVALSDWEDTLT